jgi:WD repeat-containing protein 76
MVACVRVPHCLHAILIVWDVSPSFMAEDAPFPHFRPLSRVKHNFQTVSKMSVAPCELSSLTTPVSVLVIQGKWLTLLRAQWSQNPDVYPHFTVRFAFALLAGNTSTS